MSTFTPSICGTQSHTHSLLVHDQTNAHHGPQPNPDAFNTALDLIEPLHKHRDAHHPLPEECQLAWDRFAGSLTMIPHNDPMPIGIKKIFNFLFGSLNKILANDPVPCVLIYCHQRKINPSLIHKSLTWTCTLLRHISKLYRLFENSRQPLP